MYSRHPVVAGKGSNLNLPQGVDVLVIGAGQAGIACGRLLSRTNLDYLIVDAEEGPGGAWRHTWDSLRLFSPAFWSSLPGMIMPGGRDYYPEREEVLEYFSEYERRYDLKIARPIRVKGVRQNAGGDSLVAETDAGSIEARAVISATGTWLEQYIPDYPCRDSFQGVQVHSAHYRSPEEFRNKRVLVVGGGNSGAQIMAELSLVADATWVTRREPQFLPDDVDGRHLFDRATQKYQAREQGLDPDAVVDDLLGSIVMVPSVREARDRGDLEAVRPFKRFTERGVTWPDGAEEEIDAVIWCTGFRPALSHLEPLGVIEANGRVRVDGTRSIVEPRLWLVGYGEWTGFASATIIGVGRSVRETVNEILEVLEASE